MVASISIEVKMNHLGSFKEQMSQSKEEIMPYIFEQ